MTSPHINSSAPAPATPPVAPQPASPGGRSAPPARRGRGRKVLVPGLLVLAAAGAAVYFLAVAPRLQTDQQLRAAAAAADQVTVLVVRPTPMPTAPELNLPGDVLANQQTSVYGRIDGYVQRWYADLGARVQAGQVLADVEAPQVDAGLRMAEAQLVLAEANLKLAQANASRSQQLFTNKVASPQELDTILATERVQAAARDNAAAALQSAQDLKGFEQIRAPFTGTVTARYVDVGSLVTSGSNANVPKLFDVAQSDPVRVNVNVPQADVSSVRAGTPAAVAVDQYPGQTFAGTVARDAGAFDARSRTLLLQIDVPNPDGRLYAGMYAHVRFVLPNPTPALLIPDNALLIDARGTRVLVVDPSGKVRIKAVTLGRDYGTKTEVLGGLEPSDQVVQNPPDALPEGTSVTVQAAAPAASPAPGGH